MIKARPGERRLVERVLDPLGDAVSAARAQAAAGDRAVSGQRQFLGAGGVRPRGPAALARALGPAAPESGRLSVVAR